MLKDYLSEKNISIYKLAKDSSVPYSTLNDIANNKVMVENCRAGDIESIASVLGISMESLMNICRDQFAVNADGEEIPARVFAEEKKYYVSFEYGKKHYKEYLCRMDKINSHFVNDFADWAIRNAVDTAKLEAINDELRIDAEK